MFNNCCEPLISACAEPEFTGGKLDGTETYWITQTISVRQPSMEDFGTCLKGTGT